MLRDARAARARWMADFSLHRLSGLGSGSGEGMAVLPQAFVVRNCVQTEMGYKVVPRLRESCLLTSSRRGA